MSYLDLLKTTAPELILTISALLVLGVDLLVMRGQSIKDRFLVGGLFAMLGCLATIAWLAVIHASSETGLNPLLAGVMHVDDPLSRVIKIVLIIMSICTVILSLEAKFTEHIGEYLALILFATIGMMLLVSAADLLMVFISLELTSLSLYILTAFNKRNAKSVEAALKYFLFGGVAAAFTLFGISLVYGMAGSNNLRAIGVSFASNQGSPSLLLTAMTMTLVGFGFKIALVPFHLWAPDAYEGAPTPSVALIASGSKLAGFFILAKIVMLSFGPLHGSAAMHRFATGWLPLLAGLGVLSIVLGNLAAIAQSNVKRLLAYSAIAQAGYAVLGIISNTSDGVAAVIFYMVTYGLTIIGLFGATGMVEENRGDVRIIDFAGLSRQAPWLSASIAVFTLSLAGMPPLAGFFGKFYLFKAALSGASDLGLLWVVVVAIAMSAVSLYYYLQILKQIYVAPADPTQPVFRMSPLSGALIISLALAVVAAGCFPDIFLRWLIPAVETFSFKVAK